MGEGMAAGARLSVDIGGTFTDLVLLRGDGTSFSCKVSSTPESPEDAVINGLQLILDQSALEASDIVEVLHGTTVGSNTLLQKLGARCGLITTKGFRDVLEIGRLRTPSMFDLGWDKPEPLVTRRYRREVNERITSEGRVLRPLDVEGVLAAGRLFRAEGIESVAICFINSHKNPEHERQAANLLLDAFPELAVTASVDVLPEAGEYERTSTTAVNAYVLPALRGYLSRLSEKLRTKGVIAPLFIGNSMVACRARMSLGRSRCFLSHRAGPPEPSAPRESEPAWARKPGRLRHGWHDGFGRTYPSRCIEPNQ